MDRLGKGADLDRDGRVDQSEWQEFIARQGGDLVGGGAAGGVFRVLAYAPVYSCSPPTVFLGAITAAQIAVYLVSIYSPESLGISSQFGESAWPSTLR